MICFILIKKTASKIMNNKANVPRKIKGVLDKDVTSVEGLKKHIQRTLIPLIIPEKIEMICQSLFDAICQYPDVPTVIKEEVVRCNATGDSSGLIATAVRFSLMIPNKHIDGNGDNDADYKAEIAAETKRIDSVNSDTVEEGNRATSEEVMPLQKILEYLSDPVEWERSYSMESDIRYYKFAPEYTIEHTFESVDGRDGYEYYLFLQRDTTPHWTDIWLKYHQTILYHTQGILLDGGRYFTPCPNWGVVYPFCEEEEAVIYKYLVKDSCDEIIHKFYYNSENLEERYAHDKFIDSIIMFSKEEERNCFEEFASRHWCEYEKRSSELKLPYIEANSEQATDYYKNVYRNVRLLQLMYRDFISMEYSKRD